MDVMLWVLIGLAGGLLVGALMPDMGRGSVSGSGSRRVRAVVAGLSGAVAAGYGILRLEPALITDGLTTALAALAGALWLSGIVEMYSSRRRSGEAGSIRAPLPTGLPAAIDMPAYDAARQALVGGLIEDALAHEAGRYAEIGQQLPAVRHSVSRQDPSSIARLELALRFWRGWTEARDRRGVESDSDGAVALTDWPRFARTIASDLALDRDTMDPAVVNRFAFATASPPATPAVLAGTRLVTASDER